MSGDQVQVHQVMGDVRGRPCILFDDMISTGGTIAAAAGALLDAGASRVDTVAATHGVFSPAAAATLRDGDVSNVIVTDTVPAHQHWPAVHTVSVVPLLAETMAALSLRAATQ